MPTVGSKIKKIDAYKDKAPTCPGPTCKYVDHVIEILIEEIKPLIPAKDKAFYLEVQENLKAELEFIRECNRGLREHSKYWYESFKKEVK